MKKQICIMAALLILSAMLLSGCRVQVSVKHKHPGSAGEELPADPESVETLLEMGEKYMNGTETEPDVIKAMEYYNRAAAAGSAEASEALGSFFEYENGENIHNFELARQYYIHSAGQGNEFVSEEIRRVENKIRILEESPRLAAGDLYDRGEEQYYEQRDYGLAMAYYELAAGRGYDKALFSAGFMYDEGAGVRKNYKKAVKYYEEAAALDNVEALGKLAEMYMDGRGVGQDPEKAVKLFAKGAKGGDWYAQLRLGEIYENGENGIAQNNKKALKYYQMALDNGAESAAEALERIRGIQ